MPYLEGAGRHDHCYGKCLANPPGEPGSHWDLFKTSRAGKTPSL